MKNVKEAVKVLGISQSKLYEFVAARRIAHYRIGGKILFADEDLAVYLQGCRVERAEEKTPLLRPHVRLKHLREHPSARPPASTSVHG